MALAAAAGLDQERGLPYSDLVLVSLSEAATIALETLMSSGTYEYQSAFAKKHRAEGRAEGIAEGEASGKAKSVLTFLAARKIEVSAEQQARILATTDLGVLDEWTRRAVSITRAEELFEQ